MPVPPYPALSKWPRGSFQWAMDQLEAGNHVRRAGWPIEVEGESIRIWKLYKDYSLSGVFKGFSSGVVGADGDNVGDLGTDSCGYYPSEADFSAMDWQLVTEVSRNQIDYLNAHRLPHRPSYEPPELTRLERWWSSLLVMLIVILIASFGFLLWRLS